MLKKIGSFSGTVAPRMPRTMVCFDQQKAFTTLRDSQINCMQAKKLMMKIEIDSAYTSEA
jgi:hypothetical protein